MTLQEHIDSFLLDSVLPVVQDTIERDSGYIWAKIEKTAKDIRGDKVISKTRFQSEQGLGFRGRGEPLPPSGKAKFLDATVELAYGYGQFDLYGQDKVLSDTTKKTEAVESILTDKSQDLTKSFWADMDRIVWGDGTGVITNVAEDGTGGVTTVAVDSVANLYLGELISFESGNPVGGYVEITGINTTDNEITFTPSATPADGDYITRYGNYNKEFPGLHKMLWPDTFGGSITWGSYLGIPRDTYPDFRPLFLYNEGAPGTARDLTLDLIDDLVFGCYDRECSNNLVLVCGTSIFRAIKTLRQAIKADTNYKDIGLGYKAPTYETPDAEIPIVMARRAWANSLVLLDLNDITVRRPLDLQWKFGVAGSILHPVEGYDLERATLVFYGTLFNPNPKHSGVLTDIRYPVA